MKITKKFRISYGHLLPNHDGKCRNNHGHNALIEITVESSNVFNNGPQEGMVIDFGRLKEIVNSSIGNWDHKFLAKGDEWVVEGARLYDELHQDHFLKAIDQIAFVDFRTTAENLAKEAFRLVDKKLRAATQNLVWVTSVRWWETEDSFAEYKEEMQQGLK